MNDGWPKNGDRPGLCNFVCSVHIVSTIVCCAELAAWDRGRTIDCHVDVCAHVLWALMPWFVTVEMESPVWHVWTLNCPAAVPHSWW